MKPYIKRKHIIILGGLVVLLPVILQYTVFANNIISNTSNDGWASFLGSYIGGVFGGGMTLTAVLISIQETRRIQEENKIESRTRLARTEFRDSIRTNKIQHENEILQKRKERIGFCNEIAELIGRYCADISRYFYDCRFEPKLADRIVSNECFFILNIKLKDIDIAKNLLDELNDVHNAVWSNDRELEYITEATSNLMTITVSFINAYIEDVDLTS
ncbi:hypothetical protein HMPREF7545_1753 [Selenomonas noxia ATCC 43541]|uniref:hypothetical protein n=1 Tax=Selenomonas noxia TaxID=135083 RepID=UPI0001BCEF27|nr:hypothetical protein [Selenomonas noxia]EFF65382.1 hypothetical protein HMPREF7545_1753 [Selenomonas noxia ATCC 43541]